MSLGPYERERFLGVETSRLEARRRLDEDEGVLAGFEGQALLLRRVERGVPVQGRRVEHAVAEDRNRLIGADVQGLRGGDTAGDLRTVVGGGVADGDLAAGGDP